MSGYWSWQNNAYTWVTGHWETPPSPGAIYVPPTWENRGNGYAFMSGFWQQQQGEAPPPAAEVVATTPPPPPPREVIVERDRPSRSHIWISGTWRWQGGRYVWIPGHWELPPRHHAVYVEPRWERRGGSYVYVQGFWR